MDEDRIRLSEKLTQVADDIAGVPHGLPWSELCGERAIPHEEINRRGRKAGLLSPDEFIIELRIGPHPESSWRFYHPDRRRPVIAGFIKGADGWPQRITPGKAEGAARYLRAWAKECKAKRSARRPVSPASPVTAETRSLGSLAAQPCPTPIHMLPSMVADFAHRLWTIIPVARKLVVNMRVLEEANAAGVLSAIVLTGEAPYEGRHIGEDCTTPEDLQCDAAIRAVKCTQHLHNAIPELLDRLATAAAWIDPEFGARKRGNLWSDRAAADLRDLREAPWRGKAADQLRSPPRPDQGVSACVEAISQRLEQRIVDLGAIKRSRAKPAPPDPALTPEVCRELHPVEATALLQLGTRLYWGIDELPDFIGIDMLRRLDSLGFVQVCLTRLSRPTLQDGEYVPARATRGGWIIPMSRQGKPLTWDQVFRRHKLSEWEHPAEVALSERGKAEITRLHLALSPPPSGGGRPKRPVWIRSDDAAERSGLDPNSIRIRAVRERWKIKKSGTLNCYRLVDLETAWPHRDFLADTGAQ